MPDLITIKESVHKALNEIRPFLNKDGGDIEVIEITDEMELHVSFTGACKTCDMNTMTFTSGVEDAIRRNVPEIKKVVSI